MCVCVGGHTKKSDKNNKKSKRLQLHEQIRAIRINYYYLILTGLLAQWLECSPMVQETGVQSLVESYQILKKWYLMPPCLTLSITRYGTRVSGAILGLDEGITYPQLQSANLLEKKKWEVILLKLSKKLGECPCGVMVNVLDCGIVVREFELQSCYYVHFQTNPLGKGMNPLILPAMG